jgi:glycosyltransferase involved in cell wall biosynthesis
LISPRPSERVLTIIPAFNEAESLGTLVAELRRLEPQIDVLVIDDGSTDATPEVLRPLGVTWLRLPIQLGVGSAVRAGLRFAQLHGYSAAVRLDGDGQHPPEQVPALLDALARPGVDAVRGSRYLAKPGYRAPLVRRLARWVLSPLLRIATGRRISDPTSGFWAFGPAAIRLLARAHPTGYAEPELALVLHHAGLEVAEAAVEMRQRLRGETSLTWARLPLAVARALLAMLLVPLRRAESAGRA